MAVGIKHRYRPSKLNNNPTEPNINHVISYSKTKQPVEQGSRASNTTIVRSPCTLRFLSKTFIMLLLWITTLHLWSTFHRQEVLDRKPRASARCTTTYMECLISNRLELIGLAWDSLSLLVWTKIIRWSKVAPSLALTTAVLREKTKYWVPDPRLML